MKLKAFQAYLDKHQIDIAILMGSDSHIVYFSQMEPSHAIFLIGTRRADLYLSKLDKPPKIPGIRNKIIPRKWTEKFSNNAHKVIGINKGHLTVEMHEKLQKCYPNASFVDIGQQITSLRTFKTQEEVKHITRACRITTEAFNSLLEELSSGSLRTEKDVALFLERTMRSAGADLAFPSIVASGKNAATPHHVTSTQKLKQGFLQLDFGARWKNYCADMSRVLYLGVPSAEEQTMYQLLLQAQEGAITKIAPDVSFEALDKCCRKVLGKHAKYFTHSLGHGVGVDIHETPVFSNAKVAINQVFTIEPGVYFPNKYGLRIEDTLLFDGKARILTKASKGLKVITWH